MSLVNQDEVEMLAQFGITKVPVYQYHYREWRYSNQADARHGPFRCSAGRAQARDRAATGPEVRLGGMRLAALSPPSTSSLAGRVLIRSPGL